MNELEEIYLFIKHKQMKQFKDVEAPSMWSLRHPRPLHRPPPERQQEVSATACLCSCFDHSQGQSLSLSVQALTDFEDFLEILDNIFVTVNIKTLPECGICWAPHQVGLRIEILASITFPEVFGIRRGGSLVHFTI